MSGISCPFVADYGAHSCVVEGCDHYLTKANKCDSNCPVNSYENYGDYENGAFNMRLYFCFECNSLCNGCYGIEEDNKMNCRSCISGYIFYNGNCYQIIDSNIIYFFKVKIMMPCTRLYRIKKIKVIFL